MNEVGYFEIQSDNLDKAIEFYSSIFGWEFTKQEGLPIEYYQIKTEGINGGLLPRPAQRPASMQGTNAFTCSLQVESFDATAEKILKLGGQVAMEKFAIPGKCWQGYFLDLDGNVFGLFQVDETAA
jgi:predicted enzyme related to lactoylglutathione lyase